MPEADGIVIEALLDDVLDPSLVRDAIEEAVGLIGGETASEKDQVFQLDRTIARVEQNGPD